MTQQEFFNRYNFDIRTDRLGGGGFGTVYKAYDSVLHREVALKVSEVKYGPNGKVFSLKDEFDAIKDLPPHPNIANYESLYSFDMPNGRFDYAVMQYYPGGNLSELLQKGLSYSQKEGLARQLLEGIAFLHQHKVVHRDLKPANILVEKRGIYYIPLITDFGLSKAAAVDDRSMFSNSFGGGTHRYSSPEQLQGKPLRLNTDLWSYGVVVYELFTGEPLFEAGSSAKDSAQADLEVYHKIIAGDVGGQLSKVPELWQRVLRRCLVVNPDQRVKEAGELLAMIGKTSTSRADYSSSRGISDGTKLENTTTVEDKRTVGKYGNDRTIVEGEGMKSFKSSSTTTPKKPITTIHHSQTHKPKSRKRFFWVLGGAIFATVMAIILIYLFTRPKTEGIAVDVVTSENGDYLFTIGDVSFTMKNVEGGTFIMGSDSFDDETEHQVELSDFYMGETEVTKALWKVVMGRRLLNNDEGNYPVSKVSWVDCQKFLEKINVLLSEKLPNGYSFELPTEAEWEYAARGGKKSEGYKYAGSNNIDEVAWYLCNSGEKTLTETENMGWRAYRRILRKNKCKTHLVKQKKPNELGLYDMSGNVEEWCADQYNGDYYAYSPLHNPLNLPSDELDGNRVYRGGNYSDEHISCQVNKRGCRSPKSNSKGRGFRISLVHHRYKRPLGDETAEEYNPPAPITYVTPKKPVQVKNFSVKGVQFTMVKVEGSTFRMGATSEQDSSWAVNELPVHEVSLSDYWIGETEVTQALWEAVMGYSVEQLLKQHDYDRKFWCHFGDNYPMSFVSYEDALKLCDILNDILKDNLPKGFRFSLPTEAQWEYAARGGNRSQGYKYSGSNDLDEVAWYNTSVPNSDNLPHLVKLKKANELGLYDMSGNVWEWCVDAYKLYSILPKTDPKGAPPKIDGRAILRGGSTSYEGDACRVSNRHTYEPNSCIMEHGFRLALVRE